MFRLTLFTREEWRSARNCEPDSQAREAARMFQVRCHENSLMLGIRRSQIVLTFTLICFGNDSFTLSHKRRLKRPVLLVQTFLLRQSEMQVILRADGAITCSFLFSINTGARVSEALSVRVR